jgi:hypothetical protein
MTSPSGSLERYAFGAKNLKRFPQNEIDMGVVQMQEKKLRRGSGK